MSDRVKIKHHIKPKKEKKKITLEAYEKNLKLNLEAKRKDFDNITTSIIPAQLNLVKTYLWLSSLSFSVITLLITKRDNHSFDTSFFVLVLGAMLCVLTIVLALLAIFKMRDRSMAHCEEDNRFLQIAQNESEHTEGLLVLLTVTNSALDEAKETVKKTGIFLRYVLISTIMCIICIIIGSSIYLYSLSNSMKGGKNMSEKQETTRPSAPSQPVKKPEVLKTNGHESYGNAIEKRYRDGFVSTEDRKTTSDQNKTKK